MMLWYRFLLWLSPKPYCWRVPFGKPLELYRCQVDRRLLTLAMMQTGLCAGHKIGQPAYPSLFELLLIWLRLIR